MILLPLSHTAAWTVFEGRKELKRYGVLFTCLALRAIHVEVLDDMSTDSLTNAFRCLIAIRGNVCSIRCDQGSNFIGAQNDLKAAMKEIKNEEIKGVLLKYNCEFIMNPPSASHMGGIWERQIPTVRSVLSGILLQSAGQLSTSSLRTFLYEVMAIVNSRPLTVENLNDPKWQSSPHNEIRNCHASTSRRIPKGGHICQKKVAENSVFGEPILVQMEKRISPKYSISPKMAWKETKFSSSRHSHFTRRRPSSLRLATR